MTDDERDERKSRERRGEGALRVCVCVCVCACKIELSAFISVLLYERDSPRTVCLNIRILFEGGLFAAIPA